MSQYLSNLVTRTRYGDEVLANLGGSTATARATDPLQYAINEASREPQRLPALRFNPFAVAQAVGDPVLTDQGIAFQQPAQPSPVDNIADTLSLIPSASDIATSLGDQLWNKVSATFDLSSLGDSAKLGFKYLVVAIVGVLLLTLGVFALIK